MRKNEADVVRIDVASLKRISYEFYMEAYKLTPIAENYRKLNKEQQERFDAALQKVRDWINQMKPEGISNFSEELKTVVRNARDNGEYPDFMGVFNQDKELK